MTRLSAKLEDQIMKKRMFANNVIYRFESHNRYFVCVYGRRCRAFREEISLRSVCGARNDGKPSNPDEHDKSLGGSAGQSALKREPPEMQAAHETNARGAEQA